MGENWGICHIFVCVTYDYRSQCQVLFISHDGWLNHSEKLYICIYTFIFTYIYKHRNRLFSF